MSLMSDTPNLEYANNGGFLWPSIADALDTFLRRRHRQSAPFERVWRLTHLWEGVAITLALASMSRLRQEEANDDLLRRQREFFYGKSWDPLTESFKKIPAASDGAIDQWINILDEIAKAEGLPGRFLPALHDFLKSETIDIGPLVTHWAKACDVPSEFQSKEVVEVRAAMRYINSFRNRFAHVPFPHDPLEDIATSLEHATEQLFSVCPLPTCHEKEGRSSPLTGAFRIGFCFLHGSQCESLPQGEPSPELQFVFPCQKKGTFESWPASPFVHLDSMVRAHILTRVRGLDICEYTRFRAEANAIVVISNTKISDCLPEPDKNTYRSTPSLQAEYPRGTEITFSDALEAIRNDDFETGITFFSDCVKGRPEYHIGWLRLGHARREKAVRISSSDPEAAESLLNDSLNDLERAAGHVDKYYRALAHYERSKTAYRLARLYSEGSQPSRDLYKDMKELSRAEAMKACELSTERKYQTWLEYIKNLGSVFIPPSPPE